MTTPTLPNTAWEQAVFVALFVVFTIVVLGGMFAALIRIVREFRAITDTFQTTIEKLGKDWQTYYAEREEQFWRRNSALVDMLSQLIKAFEKHDEKFDESIQEMKEAQARREASQAAATAATQQKRRSGNDPRT
jgi:hypothetical protein